MAKRRETGFCREVKDDGNGRLLFRTGDLHWRFDGVGGINLWVSLDGVTWSPGVRVPDLKAAGYFAEGFEGGRERVVLDEIKGQ